MPNLYGFAKNSKTVYVNLAYLQKWILIFNLTILHVKHFLRRLRIRYAAPLRMEKIFELTSIFGPGYLSLDGVARFRRNVGRRTHW